MSQPPLIHETEAGKTESTTPARADSVRKYFGESKNYLDIRRYMIEIRKEIVGELTAGRAFRNILDIGCGDGSISIPLLTATNRLTLLDLSDAMLARALSQVRPELLENVDTVNRDFLTAALKPRGYDLIICLGVLAHVESPQPVIERVSQLLQPGGLLILECTDSAHFTNQLTLTVGRIRSIHKRANPYRTRLVTAESVVNIAQDNGLNLLSIYRNNVALPLMGKFLSQAALQKFIRWIFGTAKRNRNAWLGKECIFALALETPVVLQEP
jgi:2-polyprenyl-3-methyl-5-hydroxy-6-metoxy-1,4-benzoquinol methylase